MVAVRVVIVGATAAGKSALASAVADAVGGEIVNADAFQLYRGMDIGTAKPSRSEQARVPHHLLDVLDIPERSTVADYQRRALHVLDDLAARGTPAVFVGGSALYVRAVLDRWDVPGTDDTLRARLEQELAQVGAPALHARLAAVDPAAAAAILPSNGRRVVRALEVVALTGRPFRATLPPPLALAPDTVLLGLDMALPALDARIEHRVAQMWTAGLVAEVESLLPQGLADSPTASRALGYAQVLRMLAGDVDEETTQRDIVHATRRFARRQLSWFRKDPRVVWLSSGDPGATVDAALAALRDVSRQGRQGPAGER